MANNFSKKISFLAILSEKRRSLFSLFKVKKWPSWSQWKQIFKVLNRKEKILFSVFLTFVIGAVSFFAFYFYLQKTEIQPASGGKYIEGIVGQPRFINPVLAASNDADRDLVELIFAGLMKYNSSGETVPDLVKEYKILEEGTVYDLSLKENALWHDGAPLTADDVVFTIKIIQNPDYKSPLQANFLGVEVEKISDHNVRFKLKKPYSAFLENLTVKILPKHIFEEISPEKFSLTIYNLKPVGSGPFQFKNISQNKIGDITSVDLVRNRNYFGEISFLKEISFLFFQTEEELIKAAKEGKIMGFAPIWPDKTDLPQKSYFLEYEFSLPRYFGVFFNPEKSKVLSQAEVRKALNHGTNKKEIIEKVLSGQGEIVDSPILPKFFSFSLPSNTWEYNSEKAKNILENAGFIIRNPEDCNEEQCQSYIREKIIEKKSVFKFESTLKKGSSGDEVRELQKCLAKDPAVYPEGEITGYFGESTKKAVIRFQEKYSEEILKPWGLTGGTGEVKTTTRAKLNEICTEAPVEVLPLEIVLLVPDQHFLVETAEILKNQWAEIGVNLIIKKVPPAQIVQEFVKPRNYESLLFGEVLGAIPNPFPFWHSTQKRDPGLNLAIYENKKADNLLKEAIEIEDWEERAKKYEEFQEILITDAPAVFLYRPNYMYLVSKEVKGITIEKITEPAKRFSEIENWHIKTKRAWQ